MIRLFVCSEEFQSPFALKLLYNIVEGIDGIKDKKTEPESEKKDEVGGVAEDPQELFKIKEEVEYEEGDGEEKLFTNIKEERKEEDTLDIEENGLNIKSEKLDLETAVPEDSLSTDSTVNFGDADDDSTVDDDEKAEVFEESESSSNNNSKLSDVVAKNVENKGLKEDLSEETSELEKLLKMSGKPITDKISEDEEDSSVKEEDKNKEKQTKPKQEDVEVLEENNDNSETLEIQNGYISDDEKSYMRIVNEEAKNLFYLSTSEEQSNDEVESEKKTHKKSRNIKEEIESKEDELDKFRANDICLEKEEKKKDIDFEDCDSLDSIILEDSDFDEKAFKPKKKKRLSSTNSDSSSDVQIYNESPEKRRKNIKKILRKEHLKVETKQAIKMEKDRKERLKERRKLFKELNDNSKLVLDVDPKTKKELVVVNEILTQKLKPHQKEGIRFMWDNCFESASRLEEDSGSGCILAHCMGLGKTLQVITLVHTLFSHNLGVQTVLIMCPLNTVRNWVSEFHVWLKDIPKPVRPFHLTSCKSEEARLKKIAFWMKNGGVMIIGYEMFRALVRKNIENKTSIVFKCLLDPGPDLVICDEGHVLKNLKSNLYKCMTYIKSLRRIVLTGTPMQNNLQEYYSMVQFVKTNILGTKKEFLNRFVNPITNGQYEDSTQMDVRLMKHRAHVLHTMLDGFIQRFQYSVLTPYLPEKQEYVISISLTDTQINLYKFFLESSDKTNRALLRDFSFMQKIWTHPLLLQRYNADANQTVKFTKDFQWKKYVKEEELEQYYSSGKIVLLLAILQKCKENGDKVLVFSQFLESLDLIEHFLLKVQNGDIPTSSRYSESWIKGEDYFRMDGSTNVNDRAEFCRKFNDSANKRSKLFLISTRAGGLGINLVAANRVVVFDTSWNPSHDLQCIFRVYRFGQKKPCYVYRFLASGSMEEKIYRRQVTKLSLAYRILDEQQIERHYSSGNLQELYKFDPIPRDKWEMPKIPKDKLFADILSTNRHWIVGYHEHDSLLENKEEEELTEEERKAAWEEYEKEKILPEFQIEGNSVLNVANQTDKISNDALQVVGYYKRGMAPTENNLIRNSCDNNLFKIENVRTLQEKLESINVVPQTMHRMLDVGRSMGITPFVGETFTNYLRRLDITVRNSGAERSTIKSNLGQ